jgi:hypothetical protein
VFNEAWLLEEKSVHYRRYISRMTDRSLYVNLQLEWCWWWQLKRNAMYVFVQTLFCNVIPRFISTDFALACSKRYIHVAGLIVIVIMGVIALNDAGELLCFVRSVSQNVSSIDVWFLS